MCTEHQHALARLAAASQDRHSKVMKGVSWWKLLGLPVTLALSGFFMSIGRADLFSHFERFQFFFYSMPLWLLMHAVFIAYFDPLVTDETAAVLGRMRSSGFDPSGRELIKRGSMIKHGMVLAYLYSSDAGDKWPPPPLIAQTIFEYYQACAKANYLPYSRSLIRVEIIAQSCLASIFAVCAIGALSGRIEGGIGLDGPGLIVTQAIGAGLYIASTCSKIREVALLQALGSIVNERLS
jgi:hypothetical protein